MKCLYDILHFKYNNKNIIYLKDAAMLNSFRVVQ